MKNFILLLLLVIPLSLSANQRHLEFSHINLPNNIISKGIKNFIEDDKGYLWFGTSSGLFRYDGYNFVKKGGYNIYDLQNDGEGNLWIVTYGGLFKYNIHTEVIKEVELPFKNFIGHCIIHSKNNEMIFGSSKGLSIIDPKTEEVKHFQQIEGLESGLSSNIIRVIYEDINGNLWLGTHDKLNFFDRQNNKFSNYRIQDKGEVYKKNNLILDIIPLNKSDDDILLVGTETGLALFDRKHGTFKKFHHSSSPYSISNDVVKTLCRVNDDEVWIGTGNGLNIFDVKNQKFERFYASYNNHFSISDDIIYKIYKDKNSTIWLGTNNGIDKIKLSNNTFLVNTIPESEVLLEMGITINKFAFADNGDIWFATNKKGVIKYEKKKDKYITYSVPKVLHSNVKDVLIDKHQNIWIATPGGLNVIDEKNNKIYAYNADKGTEGALQTDYLNRLVMSPKGQIWLGSLKGLYKVTQKENHKLHFTLFEHDSENRNSISGNYIISVSFNNDENPWVLTGNGIDHFNIETGNIQHIEKPEERRNNYIRHISFTGNDTLWVAYGNNIYRHILSQNTSTFIFKANGPLKNFLVLDDDIWYTISSRLFKYNWKSQKETIYSSQITGIETYRSNAIEIHNNRVFVGGDNGFMTFIPKQVNLKPIPSKVILTSLNILNKNVDKDKEINGRVIINQPFDELKELNLNHDENSFTINFSTLDFRDDNSLQYQVKLEGLEDKWQSLEGSRNFASYIKIKPGNYTFKVKVTDNFGKFNDTVLKLKITIQPPLWATWWAKVVYFVLVCLLVYLAHRITVSNIHFQNQFELEKIKREQDDEIHQMKLKFFTNVSHELRTPLTLITSPLEELKSIEDDQQKQKLIEIITRNTKRLSRLVNQVLDLRKLDQGAEKLALSKNDMIKLTKNIVHDFMDPSLKRNIDLKFYSNETESIFMFDFEKMEKVIYNLITNALKYTPDNGNIIIKVDQLEATHPEDILPTTLCQRIRVSDSGIGISKEAQDQIFERFVNVKMENFIGQQGTGIGLSLVNDYVKMHNGWIELKSEEEKGTEFEIYLPMQEASNEEVIEVSEKEVMEQETAEVEKLEAEALQETEGSILPKLLIIDDDADMLSFLAHCFETNYQVITAKNGKEGWEQAKKQMPDLIISDWMMPEMNGVELCNKLKVNILTNHIPVIILTAKGGMDSKMEGIEKGADDYISKPFNVEYLRLRVQNIINQRKKLNEKIKREFGKETEKDAMPTFEEKFLNEVIEHIEKNIDNSEFNVKALGECIGMGQTNLYRKIKSMTGMTVNEFIRTVRLKKAGQLLKQGEFNVSDVMYMVGFTHRSYFSKSFKEMYGVTPKEYTKTTVPVI